MEFNDSQRICSVPDTVHSAGPLLVHLKIKNDYLDVGSTIWNEGIWSSFGVCHFFSLHNRQWGRILIYCQISMYMTALILWPKNIVNIINNELNMNSWSHAFNLINESKFPTQMSPTQTRGFVAKCFWRISGLTLILKRWECSYVFTFMQSFLFCVFFFSYCLNVFGRK